jgi:hypothetical protein
MIGSRQMVELSAAVRRRGGEEPEGDYEREDDLATLRESHWPIENAAWRRSEATDVLAAWLGDPQPALRRGAAVALGHVAPGVLLEELAARGAPGHADYADGVSEAVWALGDYYFGDYGCPGYLERSPMTMMCATPSTKSSPGWRPP